MVKKDKEEKEKFTLKSRVKVKDILKKSKMEVTIPNREIASHWNEENRFFKGKFEQERDMFFK